MKRIKYEIKRAKQELKRRDKERRELRKAAGIIQAHEYQLCK